jgi:hypothetical protein
MTSETGNDKPALGGTDRPHATLDLKATEIFPEGKKPEPGPQTALPPGSDAPGEAEPGPAPSAEPEMDVQPAAPRGAGIGSFLTHLAAGFVGAVLALAGALLLGLTGRGEDEAAARALADAQQRIAAVENAARKAGADVSSAEARLKTASDQDAAMKKDIAALGNRLQSLETRPAVANGPSPEAMEHSLQPLNAKLTELESRLAAVAKSQDDVRASTGSAALTMAVQNLRRAVADGKPFVSELKTLSTLAPEPLEVAPLEARRESGLASLSKLQRDFEMSAKSAIDAARPNGDGSFTGDLLAKARGLVRVRPTGDIAGDGPEAILARAEHRLDSGDLPAAIRETGQLTGPAAQAMTPWLTEAKAKAAADEALARIEAKLASSTGTRGG